VVRPERESRLQRLGPARERLAGDVIEEVDAHARDARFARPGNGVGNVRRPVTPAERPELGGLEALGADRDPRDPCPSKAGEVATVVGPRIRLERHLGARRQPEASPDLVQERGHRAGGQERRRATADIDRLEGRSRIAARPAEGRIKRVRPQVQLRGDGAQVRGDATARTDGGGARHDHEVTVRAEGAAERDVDVERDGGRGRRCVAGRHRSARASSPGGSICRQPSGVRRNSQESSTSWPRGAG
jgi:hypothetical protein